MIRGFFSEDDPTRRPYASIGLTFPSQPRVRGKINFVIDTGSDFTILSLADIAEFGFDVADLEPIGQVRGIGGGARSWMVDAVLRAGNHTTLLTLHVLDGGDEMPSLLGRDFMSAFTLIMRERDGLALLLDDDEADDLNLPV